MPILALRNSGSSKFVTIPAGTPILVRGIPEGFGLIEVECEGDVLAIFHRDLREKTDMIDHGLDGAA